MEVVLVELFEGVQSFSQISTTVMPTNTRFLQASCPCCCPTRSVIAMNIYVFVADKYY